MDIKGFNGPYRWLSNFWPVVIDYDGILYPSVENAYQATKTLNREERIDYFTTCSPGQAKRLGNKITLREDWNEIKVVTMLELTRLKYKEPNLEDMLRSTQDAYIEETNYWNDTFWGVCNGKGNNNLGKIIMQVRDELRNKNA